MRIVLDKKKEIKLPPKRIKPRDMNFYTAGKKSKVSQEAGISPLKLALPYIILVAAGACVFAGVKVSVWSQQNQLEDIEAYVTDFDNISMYEETRDYQSKSSSYADDLAQLKDAAESIGTYPKITADMQDKIAKCADVAVSVYINGYDASTGVLSFSATAEKVLDAPAFARALESTKQFENVQYTGYEQEKASGGYRINVVCNLSENAGKDTLVEDTTLVQYAESIAAMSPVVEETAVPLQSPETQVNDNE